MKDGALVKCAAMVAIPVTYAVYMVCTPEPQDGILFGSVMAVMAGLAGYDIGSKAKKPV